jgi:arylsulfatase A-like enzyme
MFEQDRDRPFAVAFWSRDPDGTQHNQGDSHGVLSPGINGPTSRLALKNADHSLSQLVAWLDEHPSIKANTDVVVTSDHGFATVSRRDVARGGRVTASEAAKHSYVDDDGNVDAEKGALPYGFLAVDLAVGLRLNLFDPDRRAPDEAARPYKQLRLESEPWEHPIAGNGLLGDVIRRADGADATVIVAANGGSDLLYAPNGDSQTVRRIVQLLLSYDYVAGVFVDDKHGGIPGALPLSAIGLTGPGALPRPDIVVPFKVFYLDPDDLQTGVQVADTMLQQGQGIHGGFGRESTYNTMIAWGPDFKRGFADLAPASNADIASTLSHILGVKPRPKGALSGRVLRESLAGGPDASAVEIKTLMSASVNALRTVLFYQEFDGRRYLTTACRTPDSQPKPTPAACR